MVGDPALRVLLVEDESVVALDIAHQLQSLGYEALGPVDRGEDAIEVAVDERPDLILMDIRLNGEMDGITAARRIVAEAEIPVVFVSAYSDRDSVERAKQSIPSGYILKPFQERELAIAIELALYRHAAEKELAAGRELLKSTVAAISDAVVTTDSSRMVRLANPAARDLLILSDADIGRDISSLASFDSVEEMPDHPHRRLLTRRDGTTVPVEITISRLHEGGEVLVIRDASIQAATENRLIEARRHAEVAARAKSDFLARVSHELRTPLNSILGMTDLALQRSADSEQRQYLELVRYSGDALNRLIGDILDFSRIESGELALTEETINLSQLVEATVRESASAARQKGLGLYLRLGTDCDRDIRIDGSRLRQMLLALIGNAVKFTESGEVRVAAQCICDQSEEPEIRFVVEDSGPGMSEEALATVFQPFSQGDSVLTREYGGTGIGLAIVNRTVGLFGGSLEADSVEGVGSTFTVLVPCRNVGGAPRVVPIGKRAAVRTGSSWFKETLEEYGVHLGLAIVAEGEDPDVLFVDGQNPGTAVMAGAGHRIALDVPTSASSVASLVCDDAQPEPEPSSLAGQKMLLVEDNRINRMLARRLLENEGCIVAEVGSGREALAILESEPFDCVLLDIEMPEMDGYETARRIRGGGHGDPSIPIFSVTGHDARQETARVKKAGIDAQLSKPFRVEDLAALLAKSSYREGRRDIDGGPLEEFVEGAQNALRDEAFQRLAELCKSARSDLSGDARAAEIVFRIQLASRKGDAGQAAALITLLETAAFGKKPNNHYNVTREHA